MSNKNRRLNVSYIVNFLLTLQSNFKGMDKPIFKLITLIEADEFLASLPDKAREKVLYNIRKVRFGVKDPELFCKLDNDIWEFRTAYQGMAYRLFAFWDNDGETLVIATHGIAKKKQKTPQKEKDKAIALRKEWFDNKNK